VIVPTPPRGNAAGDALRSAGDARLEPCALVTRSVTGCISTRSVGTIQKRDCCAIQREQAPSPQVLTATPCCVRHDRSRALRGNAARDAPRPFRKLERGASREAFPRERGNDSSERLYNPAQRLHRPFRSLIPWAAIIQADTVPEPLCRRKNRPRRNADPLRQRHLKQLQ
jgi:hypothetical protein